MYIRSSDLAYSIDLVIDLPNIKYIVLYTNLCTDLFIRIAFKLVGEIRDRKEN